MKFKEIIHDNVKPDGTFTDKPGAVTTTGSVRMGRGEGCGSPNCKCSEGFWLSIISPIKKGKVKVMSATFDSESEMNDFLELQAITNPY